MYIIIKSYLNIHVTCKYSSCTLNCQLGSNAYVLNIGIPTIENSNTDEEFNLFSVKLNLNACTQKVNRSHIQNKTSLKNIKLAQNEETLFTLANTSFAL